MKKVDLFLRNQQIHREKKKKGKKKKKKMMMMAEKKKMMVLCLVVFLISSSFMDGVESQVDCYDACSTGCVQRDSRLMARCDRKCQIKCAPGLQAEGLVSSTTP
ncbi:unnamed protein product [Camellia sinensis]